MKKNWRMYAQAFPIPAQNCHTYLAVRKWAFFNRQPQLKTSTGRMFDFFHLYQEYSIEDTYLRWSRWGPMCMYSELVPFSLGSFLACHGPWFPMDPMWWMLLMKGVNLKSPAGYSRSIHKAASSPIQCSLHWQRKAQGEVRRWNWIWSSEAGNKKQHSHTPRNVISPSTAGRHVEFLAVMYRRPSYS